ncbi:DoxX family protein [Amycolatopsis cynarae]|uniref:DoxX family protein n=1 Tax=Amycolatopsis cynarae TaxID=2995223 RepID=A0ABY7AWF9_9PSEU|nr:DoxX family protein [Amycolatopsis sp. HUAS 11-8]WAL64352.1 DoxX family protein [Amycolatopsis sp. HUAS 11-8]
MTQGDEYARPSLFTESGYFDPQDPGAGLPDPEDRLAYDDDRAARWHGGLDFGLLILRIVLGGALGAHGLQKVFGLFSGPGIAEFARILAAHGYTSQTTALSWVAGVTEIVAGGLLVLGLFTPAAAGALLAITANVVYLEYRAGFFLDSNAAGSGFEYHLVLGGIALALLFTGPGRISLDVNTPWRRRPVPFGFVGFVLAAGAMAIVLSLFR